MDGAILGTLPIVPGAENMLCDPSGATELKKGKLFVERGAEGRALAQLLYV